MLYHITKDYKYDYKYGFANAQGEIVVEPIYSSVGSFSEDRCVVVKPGKPREPRSRCKGYIDSTGEIVIPLKNIAYCSDFSEGLAPYDDDWEKDKVGFIDRWGEIIIEPQFEIDYEGEGASGFHEGVAAVAIPDGCIYIDTEGKRLFDGTVFEIARRFSNGYALVQHFSKTPGESEELFLIDKNGNRLETIPCGFRTLSIGFREGLCEVYLRGLNKNEQDRISFIDTTGSFAFEGRFADSSGFHEGLCTVRKAGTKYGVINTKGEWVIEPKYGSIGLFSNGIAPFAEEEEKYGLINNRGEIILPPRFYKINNFTPNVSRTTIYQNSEPQELTIATIFEESTKKPPKDVYINRAGEIVMPYDISDN